MTVSNRWIATLATTAFVAGVTASGATHAQEALLPIEALPLAESLATGELDINRSRFSGPTLIAAQPARVLSGIVIDRGDGRIGREGVLAYVVLGAIERDADGRLKTDLPPDRKAWCELESRFGTRRCYKDYDGDGKLETVVDGLGPERGAVSLNRLEKPQQMDPLAYRPATTEELPVLQIGYVSCGSLPDRYRFYTYVRQTKRGKAVGPMLSAPCVQTAKPAEDGSTPVQFDRFKVEVREERGKWRTRLVEGIPAGTLLGNVRTDRPLVDAVNATGYGADLAEESGGAPFLHFARPPTVAAGEISAGGTFVSGIVRHALTGRLLEPLVSRKGSLLLPSKSTELFPAGTSMFGALMGDTRYADSEVVWCTPHRKEGAPWVATCFPLVGGRTAVEVRSAFVVQQFYVPQPSSYVNEPMVERGVVDFPLLHASLSFKQWRDDVVVLSLQAAPSDTSTEDFEITAARASDGSALLQFGRGEIRLKPGNSPTTAIVSIERDVVAGDTAIP